MAEAELGAMARALLALPRRAEAILSKMERGELAVRVPQIAEQVDRLELAVRRLVGGVIFAALLMGGVQLYLAGQVLFGSILLAIAGAALVWVVFAR